MSIHRSVGLGDLLPVLLLHEVDRLLADHPRDGAGPAQQLHPLAHEDLVVPAADRIEAEVAVIVDVGDHHADLVDVAGQHDARRRLGIDGGEGVAAHVRVHPFGEAAGLLPPRAGGQDLEGRWTGSVEQASQELQRTGIHGCDGAK